MLQVVVMPMDLHPLLHRSLLGQIRSHNRNKLPRHPRPCPHLAVVVVVVVQLAVVAGKILRRGELRSWSITRPSSAHSTASMTPRR